MTAPLAYRRVLLKLSGEALMGDEDYGIDPKVIGRLADEVIEAQKAGAEVGLVIGGGNIFRGAGLAAAGMDRVTGDQMGMLATVINALAMQDALEKLGAKARVMSAIKINDVCEDYIRRRAIRHLEKGRIAIFAAGVGSPFFTTDSGADALPFTVAAPDGVRGGHLDLDASASSQFISGLLLAAPLTVVLYVLVKRLYVRELLDTETVIPGESASEKAGS